MSLQSSLSLCVALLGAVTLVACGEETETPVGQSTSDAIGGDGVTVTDGVDIIIRVRSGD